MVSHHAPGWFGKVAMIGDFASRRLAPDWVQSCDQWLSSCVQASQSALGARWLEVYLAAPIWRFAWAPGTVDEHWWYGLLMPSCDSSGRYFPLLVAQSRAHAVADRIGVDHLEAWWAHVAHAAMQTLAEGARLEDFEDALRHAPPWPGAAPSAPLRATASGARQRFMFPPSASASLVMQGWAAHSMLQQLEGCSIWWPLREGSPSGSLTVARGLPAAEQFAELLLGQW